MKDFRESTLKLFCGAHRTKIFIFKYVLFFLGLQNFQFKTFQMLYHLCLNLVCHSFLCLRESFIDKQLLKILPSRVIWNNYLNILPGRVSIRGTTILPTIRDQRAIFCQLERKKKDLYDTSLFPRKDCRIMILFRRLMTASQPV